MKLPPSIEAIVLHYNGPVQYDFVRSIAREACRLQRERDIVALNGVYSANYMYEASPLVVPSTEDEDV